LILHKAFRRSGDLPPRVLPFVAVVLFGDDVVRSAIELDPHLVGTCRQVTGVLRSIPDLLPTVVSTRATVSPNSFPPVRARRIAHLFTSRMNNPAPG
jgi:hypothetical protein